jgi:predicted GIY-YIG superfamily endonuclease
MTPTYAMTRPDGTVDTDALAAMLLQTARELRVNGNVLFKDPAVAESAEQLLMSCETYRLRVEFLLAVDQLDTLYAELPQIEARLAHPRKTGRFEQNAGTFVYAAYDRNDKLLYVGITDDLWGRMSQHRRLSRWWKHMERLDWEEWPDREAALGKESVLIRRHRPPYNIAGNPDARRNK